MRDQQKKGAREPRRLSAWRRRQRKWIVGGLLVLLAIAGVGAWQWYVASATPEAAPRFRLPASNGRSIGLDDYLGKQEVVLFFYMTAG